jgi:hypothetical protein
MINKGHVGGSQHRLELDYCKKRLDMDGIDMGLAVMI